MGPWNNYGGYDILDPQGVPDVSPNEMDMNYNDKIEPINRIVHDKAFEKAGKNPGSYTIDQICAIFDYLHNNWHYVKGPNDAVCRNYANESIRLGESVGGSGVGNCGDFAVLMASMIEAIGGSARIVYVDYGNGIAHAYAEVYVGNGSAWWDNFFWLTVKYYQPATPDNPLKFFYHEESFRDASWLNLDWSSDRPGGPFNKGINSYILWESDHPLSAPIAQSQIASMNELNRLSPGFQQPAPETPEQGLVSPEFPSHMLVPHYKGPQSSQSQPTLYYEDPQHNR